jgi:hypothetical protein
MSSAAASAPSAASPRPRKYHVLWFTCEGNGDEILLCDGRAEDDAAIALYTRALRDWAAKGGRSIPGDG